MNSTPLSLVLGVDLFHVGHLGDARAAPGRPEIDHDDLALQTFDRNRRALDGVGEFQVEWLADGVFLPARALDHSGELGIRKFLDDPIFESGLGFFILGDTGGHVQQIAAARILGGHL